MKLLLLLLFILNWKHPQPISKKKWNQSMRQHWSEEFYSRPASQRWASDMIDRKQLKTAGGSTSWHHNHNTTLYTIPYFLTATSWHEDHRCSYATHRFQHTRMSWRLRCFWSLSFFVEFFLNRRHRPHILSMKEKLFAKLQICLVCGLYYRHWQLEVIVPG